MPSEAVEFCAQLTIREREFARELAMGSTVREVAEHFGVTPKTAGTHRATILRKTRCRNLVEFARIAIAGGIVPPP